MNEEQAEYWNGDEAVHWLEYEDRYDVLLSPFVDPILRAASVAAADRVVDIGCGCGSTTRAAAKIALDGSALGVDISRPLLGRAAERAEAENLSNIAFRNLDVQTGDLGNSCFDVAVSRFGVMFFADPVAAFSNIAASLEPRGRVGFVCWADGLENEWIAVPGAALIEHVALPDQGDPESPGPFSFAKPDRIRYVLESAGLSSVAIAELRLPLVFGSEVVDAVGFMKATGFAQSVLRGVDDVTVARATAAMEKALEPYESASGVTLGSKAWLVTAKRDG
jgi:SAM-dependent methyltransferase